MLLSGPLNNPQASQKERQLAMKALAIFSAAAIVAMAGCSASSGSGGSSPASGGGGGGASSQAASGPGIGSKVRDGKFQFTITRVSHRASVGNTTLGLGTKAQGRFTELHLKVTNIGSESQTLDDASQYVFDANGRKFSADSFRRHRGQQRQRRRSVPERHQPRQHRAGAHPVRPAERRQGSQSRAA